MVVHALSAMVFGKQKQSKLCDDLDSPWIWGSGLESFSFRPELWPVTSVTQEAHMSAARAAKTSDFG